MRSGGMQCHLTHLSTQTFLVEINIQILKGKFIISSLIHKNNKFMITYSGRQNNGPPNIFRSYFTIHVNL